MKKGMMQLQTIIYVIFAVLILMAGMFSVQSYLTNLAIDMEYELDNIDQGILGKRIIGSNKCFIELHEIESVSDEKYSIPDYDQGNLIKSKISSNIDSCLAGFPKEDYQIKFYTLNPKSEFQSWGSAECEPDMELLVRFNDDLGVVEVCSDE